MKKTIMSVALIIMLAIAALVLTGCGDKKEEDKGVVGKWEYQSYVYTFNEDKTGNYDYGNSGNGMEFTYEDNGTELSITYKGNTSPLVLKYRKEGNKLIITDSFGKDVEYVKK